MKTVTPNYFFISSTSNSLSACSKNFKKIYGLEKFRANVLKNNLILLKCYSCEELRDVSHALRSCESDFSRPYTIKPSHKHWCWVLLLLSPTWLSRKLFLIPNHSKQVNFVTPNFQWADVTDKDKIGKGSIGSAIKAHYIPENSM